MLLVSICDCMWTTRGRRSAAHHIPIQLCSSHKDTRKLEPVLTLFTASIHYGRECHTGCKQNRLTHKKATTQLHNGFAQGACTPGRGTTDKGAYVRPIGFTTSPWKLLCCLSLGWQLRRHTLYPRPFIPAPPRLQLHQGTHRMHPCVNVTTTLCSLQKRAQQQVLTSAQQNRWEAAF